MVVRRFSLSLALLFVFALIAQPAFAQPKNDKKIAKQMGKLYNMGKDLPTWGAEGTEPKGAGLLYDNRDALERTDDFPRPAGFRFNALDENGKVRNEYKMPKNWTKEGLQNHMPPLQMSLQLGYGKMIEKYLQTQEKGAFFTYLGSMYETEPASAAALVGTVTNSNLMTQNAMHAVDSFRTQLQDQRPIQRAMILNMFRGCQNRHMGKGSKDGQFEAMTKCLGDNVEEPKVTFEPPAGDIDDLFKIDDHMAQKKGKTYLRSGHAGKKVSLVDLIFAEAIETDSGPKRAEWRDSFVNLYGDKIFELKKKRDKVDKGIGTTQWTFTYEPPKLDHAEVLHELTEARYKDLIDLLVKACKEHNNLNFTDGDNFNEADKKEPFTRDKSGLFEYYRVFRIEGHGNPAILFELLFSNFALRYWQYDSPKKRAKYKCNEIKQKGKLNTLTKDSPFLPVYQRYWNFANFISWAQLLQTYKQSAYVVEHFTDEGEDSDIDLRGMALQMIETTTGMKMADLESERLENVVRLEAFKSYLFDERYRLMEGGGSLIATQMASSATGEQAS